MLHERDRDQLIEDVCTFVRIPSRSSTTDGEEGELQRLMAQRMKALGARVHTFVADDIPGFRNHPVCFGPDRDYKDRPTVVGELGPEHAPALLILAHSDTVQIARPDDWTFDPFIGDVKDHTVRGLGATDDKWGLATMLAVMEAVEEPLTKRLIFASTIDEENGIGNGTLLLILAGIQAQAALYLDGIVQQISLGNLGGSNLYFHPVAPIASDVMSQHGDRLKEVCAALSHKRIPLYDRPLLADNVTRTQSVKFVEYDDENGPHFAIHFYTLPNEDTDAFCAELQEAVRQAMGKDLSLYRTHMREPWFEPALVPADTPLVRHLTDAYREVHHAAPQITTLSKQDSFVLTNYGKIPTISFGAAHFSGPGAVHEPNEFLRIDEAWAQCRAACGAVQRWLAES